MLPKYHIIQGHDVQVLASLVSFDTNGNPCLLDKESEYMTHDGYKVIRTDYKHFLYSFNKFFRRYNKVYQHINSFEPDIIFIHDCQFLDIFEVIKYLKKHPSVKVFVDGHTDLINSARNWLSREILHKIVWRYCAQAINPYTQKFFGVLPLRCSFFNEIYGIPSEKIELLVMGVDDISIPFSRREQIRTSVRKELGIAKEDFVLVTGGKIDKKKNIDLLMQAIERINTTSIKLIVFGNILPEIENTIQQLGTNTNIRLIGWVNSENIHKYFFASDLAVFPGSHSVLWEYAVGCGIPAIFKRWQGMDHVDVGGNVMFLDKDSVEELTSEITLLATDQMRYDRMKHIATTIGMDSFKYSNISSKALQINN